MKTTRGKRAKAPKGRLIRDDAFAKRLLSAAEGNPYVPEYNRGQLTWIRDQFAKRFKMSIATETVRKWFAGEARPRPEKMVILAQLLEVDVAWLSLGQSPNMEPRAREKRNSAMSGAANVLTGIIQIDGGVVAFPAEGDSKAKYIDLYAIIKGAQYAIHAALAQTSERGFTFAIPTEYSECTVIGVVKKPTDPCCDFIEIPGAMIDKHRSRHGGYYEITVGKRGNGYHVADEPVPEIKSFANRL